MPKTLKTAVALLSLCAMCGCDQGEKTIVVGASSTPHAMILERAKAAVKEKGYELKIRVFDDYVLPNLALENRELDANYFQHKPYLEEFNSANKTHLVPALDVHFEPMGIYAGKKNTLDIEEGDSIAIPSDKSNRDRALALLREHGLENAKTIEAEAQNLPLLLKDCALAVINGNYALSSGIVDKCIVTEGRTSDIAKRMANVIAVREGCEESEKTKVLKDALARKAVSDYVKSAFGDSVIYLAWTDAADRVS